MEFNPIIQKYNEVNQFGASHDLSYEIPKIGEVIYTLKVQEQHLATPKVIHGGMLAAFMDGVLGLAALSVSSEKGKLVATVEFKINFHQPVYLNETIKGYGKVITAGNRIIVSEGKLYNEQDELVASGSGTFNSYPAHKVGMDK